MSVSGPVLECARDGVGTANDTAKVAEGVTTWSKIGDGLDKVLQDGTHCVAKSETVPEATPNSVVNRKGVGTTYRPLKVTICMATQVVKSWQKSHMVG